ncbi:MAG: 5-(carboxyamino)imidazole ribonucleotide synthase [Oscillospiraceae bacterium]|nr:5-(carboxyamino)imidazole ribonucleotide synthase [Oscillospiraceae bacterium]
MSAIRKKIGIIGGGQLGKMMILEAKRLGFYIVILDPDKACPAHSISDEHIVAGFDSTKGYHKLAGKVDVITYEFEHINADALECLEEKGHLIYPSPISLKYIQNKFFQKKVLQGRGIPLPRFCVASSVREILEAGEEFGYPLMLKTMLGGYDGKGNALIKNAEGASKAFCKLGEVKNEIMVEEYIHINREISVIACRGIDKTTVTYPIAENIHRDNILDTTVVPAAVSHEVLDKAHLIAGQVMEVFEGVGTFCIELFVTEKDEIYVNEVAPRPHNSGHYTIEGCQTNQFENHIRAITGLPLGSTDLTGAAVMVNLLGQEDEGEAELLGLEEAYAEPCTHVHLYGKKKSKPGRKMGHFTATGKTVEEALKRADKARSILRVIGR